MGYKGISIIALTIIMLMNLIVLTGCDNSNNQRQEDSLQAIDK